MKITDDKINRMEFVKKLYKNIEDYNGQLGKGLTLVINGKYGVGKTTLFELLDDYNSNMKKFKIVKYDAWENNLFDDPLIPVLYLISKLESNDSKIKEIAINVIKNIPKAVLSTLANAHSIDLQSLYNSNNVFEKYDEYKLSLDKFKNVLKEYCSKNKTIVFVDELDRCLPEYQIKVLETLFHFHNIDNLIIIIALDKKQLEATIQSKFGTSINVHSYLSKFIQYEIDLPENDTYMYLLSQMRFQVWQDNYSENKRKVVEFLKVINLPLRECQLFINKLNILLNDGKDYSHSYVIFTSFLLLLKYLDNELYIKYFGGEKEYLYDIKKDVDLMETTFGMFINEIKNKEFNKILIYVKEEMHTHLSLYLINLFYPLNNISLDSISNYLQCNVENIKNVLQYKFDYRYPDNINAIIKTIERLL